MVFWFGLVWASLAACYQIIPSPDLWWLLADGRLIVETAHIPQSDPFSWSAPGSPWHNDQWLTGFLAYVVFIFWGLAGLHMIKAVMIVATVLVLLDTGRRLQRRFTPLGLTVALVLLVLCGEGRFFFDVRGYLFTYLGLSLLWRWLQLGPRLNLCKVFVLFALWTNLHGGVSSGLFLLALELGFAPSEERRHIFKAVATASIACCVNPAGFWILLHPILLLGSKWGAHLNEWVPIWQNPGRFRRHCGHLIVWLLTMKLNRKKLDQHDQVLLCFAAFSLTAWRHIPLFTLLSIPRWCRLIDGKMPLALSFLAWGGLVQWAGFLPLRLSDSTQSLEDFAFPKRACEFLRANHTPRQERLFHPYGLGGYLLWSFPRGEYRVCIDGRAVQVYPWECFESYLRAATKTSREFDAFCEANQINTVMLFTDPSITECSERLINDNPLWKVVYRDELVVVAIRVKPRLNQEHM